MCKRSFLVNVYVFKRCGKYGMLNTEAFVAVGCGSGSVGRQLHVHFVYWPRSADAIDLTSKGE